MYSYYDSPLGEMVMVSDGEYLTGLYFKGQKYFPNLNRLVLKDDLKVFLRVSKWLDGYFKGNNPKIDKSLFKFYLIFLMAKRLLIKKLVIRF